MALPKVTIVGAGQVGATTAVFIAREGLADVVLVDVAPGIARGKALDMMHARCVARFAPTVTGAEDYGPSEGSDVVVITAGVPRRPGMTREDLLATNGAIVRSVVERVVATSPDAVCVCVTNPLDVMTHLAWRTSGFVPERVLGMGGVLDSARFAYFIAEATGASPAEIEAVVIGAHGDTMVPLPRLSTVRGAPLTELLPADRIAEVVRRTVNAGAEVVALLQSGSAFYAPAASVTAMVRAILHDTGEVMPACVLLRGEYGLSGLHIGVPASLGREGVRRVVEWDLDEAELAALHASATGVAEAIRSLGADG